MDLPFDVVPAPGRPPLRFEVAGSRLLAIRQGDDPVVLGRIDDGHYGVDYVRTGRYRSPVPPLRAAHAAGLAADGGETWWARWAHHFRSELSDSAYGPLHAGRWLLSSRVPRLRRGWRWELYAADEGYVDYEGDRPLLPLRTPVGPGDGRVKAYRKQARDGSLPPVLIWWVSCLCGYVVLDGHDRLAAALAEDREPPWLELTRVDPIKAAAVTRMVVDRYLEREAIIRRSPGTAPALTVLGQRFGADLREAEHDEARTRAWPLAGGTVAWTRAAEECAPGWLTSLG
ncbi:hypothetical protein GCM10010112_88440 [Actinoplanes lobatus]|uniref:Uncharacterized protein n=1 Tax=Actinoplanes lobatus TaxID=113568 RepID=A0A7W7HHE0_9ACTN|nr:hypothetical protein [Actinoplanes lobatus]MBB4750581.1 hypothetical protein [Actinoplanes lobatus]GGN96817.1 hypothetical protein GCM10010112_88440 [Actinoplanes lobatus]GIE45484.1 hypothetical protein Alo02nite_83820 [Actinoplanes lobatus]